MLNGMITQWLKKLQRFKMQTVRMTHSHAMIILCGVSGQCRLCLAPASAEQSGHCDVQACSSHNANYDFCGSDRLLILWWEPKSQTGRGDTTLPHSCRARQLSTEGRRILWLRFIQSSADIYLFVFLWALKSTLCCFYLYCERLIPLQKL